LSDSIRSCVPISPPGSVLAIIGKRKDQGALWVIQRGSLAGIGESDRVFVSVVSGSSRERAHLYVASQRRAVCHPADEPKS